MAADPDEFAYTLVQTTIHRIISVTHFDHRVYGEDAVFSAS